MAIPFIAAASLLSGGLSMIKGTKQYKQGRELAESNPRPNMPIPTAILENQQIAKNLAQQGLPSEQYAKGVKQIDRSATNALRSATDRRGGLMSIGQIQETTNDAMGNLTAQDANARQRNQMNLINQNSQLGRYQQNAWDWNKRQKFFETASAARALMGAGAMNRNQGLDRLLAGGAEAGSYIESLINKNGKESGNPRRYTERPSNSNFQTEFD